MRNKINKDWSVILAKTVVVVATTMIFMLLLSLVTGCSSLSGKEKAVMDCACTVAGNLDYRFTTNAIPSNDGIVEGYHEYRDGDHMITLRTSDHEVITHELGHYIASDVLKSAYSNLASKDREFLATSLSYVMLGHVASQAMLMAETSLLTNSMYVGDKEHVQALHIMVYEITARKKFQQIMACTQSLRYYGDVDRFVRTKEVPCRVTPEITWDYDEKHLSLDWGEQYRNLQGTYLVFHGVDVIDYNQFNIHNGKAFVPIFNKEMEFTFLGNPPTHFEVRYNQKHIPIFNKKAIQLCY